MKVSTKIVYGFGTLIALMAALVVFQVLLINRVRTIVQDLSSVSFEVASTALELAADMNQVDEFARKAIELGDADYAKELASLQEEVERKLEQLNATAKSEKELAEVKRLSRFWEEFVAEYRSRQQAMEPGRLADFPARLSDHLQQLRLQTDNVYRASSAVIETETERSLTAGQGVKVISLVAAAIALVLSGFVSLFIVQSITIPLKHLTQGTRAIAQGKFFYRLDTSHQDEFSQVARDFNTMTERLNQLDQMKKDFVSHVSHELKAPLASMQETIQLLLEVIPGELTDKQRRLLDLNLQSGKRLSAMIANLLDMSRIEAGVMEYDLKPHDLAALARAAADEIEPLALEKNIGIRVEPAPDSLRLTCDGDRIIQVIRNLLGNAVKFSPGRSEVSVKLGLTRISSPQVPAGVRSRLGAPANDGDLALLEVADSGPGVPDEHKERIFEKFHQVKQGGKVAGQGAGLGLAISRTIAEAHRGALWVENRPAGGSVFKMLLPLGGAESEVRKRTSSPI